MDKLSKFQVGGGVAPSDMLGSSLFYKQASLPE
jgi:hypothetical protein